MKTFYPSLINKIKIIVSRIKLHWWKTDIRAFSFIFCKNKLINSITAENKELDIFEEKRKEFGKNAIQVLERLCLELKYLVGDG